MRLSDTEKYLHILIKPGKPQIKVPFIQAAPGVGKSTVVKVFADKHDFEVIDFRIGFHDATDFKMPHVYREEGSYTFLTPDILPFEGSPIYDKNFNGGKETKGILFFDEANQARPDVLMAVFQIIHDKMIGHKKLLPNWYIIAAGNIGIEDGTDVVEFSSALKDRFVFLKTEIHELYDDWMDYAKEKSIHPLVINFIRNKPSALYYGLGGEKEKKQDGFFVTPRRWEDYSNVLKENSEMNLIELIELTAPPFLFGLFMEFRGFCIEQKRVSIEDILIDFDENKEKISSLKRDEVFSILDDIISFIQNKEQNKNMFENFYKFVKSILSEDIYFTLMSKIGRKSKDDKKLENFINN
ncbi:MAG: AAA family ATPase, partial [Candidatus Woesearchaeota archaeon]